MHSAGAEGAAICHVVAMPFPGRGHINPLMNFCKLLASRKHDVLITFVVTEEWLGYLGSEPKPHCIRFATIPNVIPPERLKPVDFPGFYEAVMTKMEAPFEQLLDQLELPPTAIIGDIEVRWAIGVGNRRKIPVAAFWTMSASFFSMLYHFHLFNRNRGSTIDFSENAEIIPGISSSQAAELQAVFKRNDPRVLELAVECISVVPNAQYLIFTSIYELEAQAMDNLKQTFPFPVCPIGPAIPYLELRRNSLGVNPNPDGPGYLQFLDFQPEGSVLYISLGSFLSVSSTQMDEIVAGLQDSGVRFLWVARGEASRLKKINSDKGLVLPWCDQLKVLCHPSIGGFWTHCGWNSTLEAVFAGVPMLAFPLFLDQDPNSKQTSEDWRVGWKVNREVKEETLLTRKEIAELVQKFMDTESSEVKEMRKRAGELRDICQQAIAEGGSSASNLDAFIRNIYYEASTIDQSHVNAFQ